LFKQPLIALEHLGRGSPKGIPSLFYFIGEEINDESI
jgi:hypothetical protein